MFHLFKQQSDVEFISGLRSQRKNRLLASVLLLLFGSVCLLYVFIFSVDLYQKALDANHAAVEAFQTNESMTSVATDLIFVTGVRVGYSIAFALGLGIASIALAIDLSRSKRRDRLLLQYYDLSQQQKIEA